MQEPEPTINGQTYTPVHPVIDEFDIAADLLQPGEVLEPKKYIYEEYGEHKVKVSSAGSDIRQIPLINFLGELRPHYSAMDSEMAETLQIELLSNLRNKRRLYPEIGIASDDYLVKLSLNGLHTYNRETEKQVNGIKYGIMYEKGILATCVVLETLFTSLGLKSMKDFTENNIKVIPIFRMIAGNIASTHGGGVVETLSPTYQIGGLVVLMAVLYGGTNYIGGAKGAGLYQVISGMATQQLLAGVQQTPQMQPSIPSAQPAPAAGGFSLEGIINGVQGIAPLLGAFAGNNEEKKDKPKKKARRYRQ